MEQLLNEIRISYIDAGINENLGKIPDGQSNVAYSMHYTQSEDYFIDLPVSIIIPQLPIHHDIHREAPDAPYIRALGDVISQLIKLLPDCFAGLTYFFDPAEILRPCFYHLYRIENDIYLYMLRLDLSVHPLEIEVLQRGSNDITPAYSTKRLYFESEIIPLEAVIWDSGRVKAFTLKQIISQTWIGETGKGYRVRGIWMDTDLSKYFSRLFLAQEKRLYPFYPLFCKYRTLCLSAPVLSGDNRKKMLPVLHHAINLLLPEMGIIQESLRTSKFSEEMKEFLAMQKKIPESWKQQLNRFSMKSYLNAQEQKEYALSYDTN